ncbi:proline iminopeptidase [Neomicrococcus aestuarii]|uniref:Proline iminopeptidase n=1 Tax=Neomicrococcus aestuarii TaxID=556325 RepID=A0A7W8X0K4_9MICC|nr:alpha/beta fold hydrolase [Neomicrococcus aestuarii]MBB5511804.1 proline iminopeptidase [Neomicrococcus aestuarii]
MSQEQSAITSNAAGINRALTVGASSGSRSHVAEAPIVLRGMTATSHRFHVPLVHSDASSPSIEIFAREINSLEDTDGYDIDGEVSQGDDNQAEDNRATDQASTTRTKPWLLYLQGGPGFGAPRLSSLSGWLKEATRTFRVLLLDQRGTGLSTPINHQVLAGMAPDEQADYLTHFRADSIVRDAELIRSTLGLKSWSIFGQSFGGFCALSYLSTFPESLDRAIITGGLAPLHGSADRVYRATYARMRARNVEYFAKYPADREILNQVLECVRRGDQIFSDGRNVSVGAVQMLGMFLGGNTRIDQLHFHLEGALLTTAEGTQLSDSFKETLRQQASFASAPLYAVMHESIYAQGEATQWAANRVLAENPDFDPFSPEPLLTGEMIFPWHFTEDPALRPLKEAAERIANKADWPQLYDVERLKTNQVPVAAAVYSHDVYVDRDLSLETAQSVQGLRGWETSKFHHDGISDDGAAIFARLLGMTRVD